MNNSPLPPATAFRPLHLKWMMASLGAAWKANILPPPRLDAEELRHMAEKATGLSHDPDREFFDRQLGILLPALREEACLSPFGRLIAEGTLLKIMKERLWFARIMAEHPEIDRIELAPPIVVVGPMRSGSTRMQRLLACDPAFTALQLYESSCPVPSPAAFRARARGRRDPRITLINRALWLLTSINPAVAHIHPTGAIEVDEELGMNEQSLSGALIEAQRRVPNFARHCEQHSQLPAYRHMLRLLKLRSWFARIDPARPLVLKTPQHMQDLAALHAIFPHARLIFLHRDPVSVVASSASLAWNQMVIQSDAVDPVWVGQEWLHKTAHRLRITDEIRPTIPRENQLDVEYGAMNADWKSGMRRIYRFLGRELTPDVLARMERYIEHARRQHGYQHHRYTPEAFGLRAGEIRERLGS